MSELNNNNPNGEDDGFRVEISEDPGADWESLLAELEQHEPPSKQAKPQPPARPAKPAPRRETPRPEARTESRSETPAEPEQLEKPAPGSTPPPIRPEMDMMEHFGEILTAINTSMNQLKKFEEKHPYLIAPNIFRVWEDGLKESSLVMFREFQRLRQYERETRDES